MASSQSKEIESLILNVKKRKLLWDPSTQKFPGIRSAQRIQWEKVAERQKKSVDSVKRQWSQIKSEFNRELRKIPFTNDEYSIHPIEFQSGWIYF